MQRLRGARSGHHQPMGMLLWLVAVVLVVAGVVQLLMGEVVLGLVLIVLGCLVGPGGVSLFR